MENKNDKEYSYLIHSFIFKMQLTKCQKLVYALIVSYTKGEFGLYFGSKAYLAESTGYSERSVYRAISVLRSKNLIELTKKGSLTGFVAKIPENALSNTKQSHSKPKEETKRNGAVKIYDTQKPYTITKPKYTVKGYGTYGFVGMTREQYFTLLRLVDSETLTAYIRRLEMMLENNTKGGIPPPHSAYKTLKKWIEADFST